MTERKQVVLQHKDRLEMMRAIVKTESCALRELYDVGGEFGYKIRGELYHAINKFSEKVYMTRDNGCDCVVERETEELMPIDEALNILSDGHGCITPKEAWQVCKVLEIPYDKKMEYHGFSQHEAGGLTMAEGHEGDIIVDTGRISDYVMSFFKLNAGSYIGRGFQAQANAGAIRKYLIEKGKLAKAEVK